MGQKAARRSSLRWARLGTAALGGARWQLGCGPSRQLLTHLLPPCGSEPCSVPCPVGRGLSAPLRLQDSQSPTYSATHH